MYLVLMFLDNRIDCQRGVVKKIFSVFHFTVTVRCDKKISKPSNIMPNSVDSAIAIMFLGPQTVDFLTCGLGLGFGGLVGRL